MPYLVLSEIPLFHPQWKRECTRHLHSIFFTVRDSRIFLGGYKLESLGKFSKIQSDKGEKSGSEDLHAYLAREENNAPERLDYCFCIRTLSVISFLHNFLMSSPSIIGLVIMLSWSSWRSESWTATKTDN